MEKPCKRFLLSLVVMLATAAGAFAAAPFPVEVRPGFMTGNSDVGTEANLDILIPLWGDEKRLLFFNPNFRIDDNDGNEQNIGFGFRRMSDCGHFILGGNLFYDTMRSEQDHQYHQWGVGAELLSHWFDLRANYYDPFGDTENEVSRSGTTTANYYFSGHSLLTGGNLQVESEEALDGFDAEVSLLVPGISEIMETRLAATYYNFDADGGDDLDGWRGRVEFRPVRAVNLSVEYRDDDVRGDDTFFGGYLELPFSMDNLLAGKNPFAGAGDLWSFGKGVRHLSERMTDKVIRDRHIVTAATEEQIDTVQTVVDDQIIFVNQDNPAAGDGSFENPYQALAQAAADSRYAPGAWVYVFSTDATADTYANTNFTLLDDMVFWGQGYAHPIYGLGGGPMPILDGGYSGGFVAEADYASASVIVLANNNEVMGLTVQNGVEGIYGRNIKGTNIHDNFVRWNPHPSTRMDASGIHISNLFSPADVNGQTLNFTIKNNQIIDNGSVGIYLKNEIDGGGSQISKVTINNTIGGNTLYGNFNSSSDEDANANVYVNNYVSGGDVADFIINNTFADNYIRHCSGEICINNVDTGIKLRNEINTYSGYYTEGQLPGIVRTVVVYDGNIINAKISNYFNGNNISGLLKNSSYNSGTAVLMEQYMNGAVVTNATSENTFINNNFSSNDGSGIYSDHDGIRSFGEESTYQRAEYANGNPVQSPGSITNSHQIWNITNNMLQDNGRHGFHANNDYFSNSGDHYVNASTEFYFRNNRITGNGHLPHNMWDTDLNGIYLYTDTSQDQISRKFLLQGNLIANNFGDGVDYYWNGTNPASMQSDFGGGTLGSAGGNAFYGNIGYDINQDDNYFTTVARNNWWGQPGGPLLADIYRPTLLDPSSPLATNPFP